MSSLLFLFLNNNHLSGLLPNSLSNLTQLVVLNISYNYFNGPIPPGIVATTFSHQFYNMSLSAFTAVPTARPSFQPITPSTKQPAAAKPVCNYPSKNPFQVKPVYKYPSKKPLYKYPTNKPVTKENHGTQKPASKPVNKPHSENRQNTVTSSSDTQTSSSGLSTGAFAGIAIVIFVIITMMIYGYFLYTKKSAREVMKLTTTDGN